MVPVCVLRSMLLTPYGSSWSRSKIVGSGTVAERSCVMRRIEPQLLYDRTHFSAVQAYKGVLDQALNVYPNTSGEIHARCQGMPNLLTHLSQQLSRLPLSAESWLSGKWFRPSTVTMCGPYWALQYEMTVVFAWFRPWLKAIPNSVTWIGGP
jgi:hypothetical protein